MTKRRRPLRRHPARVVLSDVLPYELPPSFNNRGLYEFLRDTSLRIDGGNIRARRLDEMTDVLLGIILAEQVSFSSPNSRGSKEPQQLLIRANGISTVPFRYTVRHRRNDFRTLTVPHPAAQLEISAFYEKFEELLIYHTSKSQFSLRRPARVAPYVIVRDALFAVQSSGLDSVERDNREYEWLRSYFTYKRYSNVYKFYDSAEYRSCERRFGYLVKADIAKCFDSIYTHSIAWAAHGHDVVKANLGTNLAGTFGDEFDRLMQRMNHSETSGISIGPEVSRIFAEVILQAVDTSLASELGDAGMRFGSDYEILRYVDDYFIFLADETRRPFVLEALSRNLRKYKLHLNAAKEEGEFTPWESPLTVAKRRVRELIRSTRARPSDREGFSSLDVPYIHAGDLIVGYKSILLDTGVSHFDLANYTLAKIERSAERLLCKSEQGVRSVQPGHRELSKHHRALTSSLLALMDLFFFVYSGSPRMGPAVKVARLCSSLLRYSRSEGVPVHDRERLELRVKDELMQQLRRAGGSASPDAVTATLVDCVSDLGPNYAMSEAELAELCGFELDAGILRVPATMNVLILFSVLLHIKSSKAYGRVRRACESWIVDMQDRPLFDAELAILNLNVISCPFIEDSTRRLVLSRYSNAPALDADRFVRNSRTWNVDWNSFDLYAALERKRMLEVY